MNNKKFLVDLAERVGSTYAEAFVALMVVNWTDFTKVSDALTVGRAAAIAAVPAALSALKSGLAKFKGNPDSASLADSI